MKAQLLLCLLVFGVPGLAANIVTNPGFEDSGGSFNGWITGGGWYIDTNVVNSGVASARTPCAGINCLSPSGVSLSQLLNTLSGGTYSLTFSANFFAGMTPNDLQVFWDGALIDEVTNVSTSGWQQITINNLMASSNSTPLTFFGRDDPNNIFLDDISVTPLAAPDPSPTPEPSTLLSAGAALLAAGWALRRKAV